MAFTPAKSAGDFRNQVKATGIIGYTRPRNKHRRQRREVSSYYAVQHTYGFFRASNSSRIGATTNGRLERAQCLAIQSKHGGGLDNIGMHLTNSPNSH
jgi:hypothetical protein